MCPQQVMFSNLLNLPTGVGIGVVSVLHSFEIIWNKGCGPCVVCAFMPFLPLLLHYLDFFFRHGIASMP